MAPAAAPVRMWGGSWEVSEQWEKRAGYRARCQYPWICDITACLIWKKKLILCFQTKQRETDEMSGCQPAIRSCLTLPVICVHKNIFIFNSSAFIFSFSSSTPSPEQLSSHPCKMLLLMTSLCWFLFFMPLLAEILWWYEHIFSCSYKSYCNRLPTGPAQPQKLNFSLYYLWNTCKSQTDMLQGNFLQTITTVEKLDKMLWRRCF